MQRIYALLLVIFLLLSPAESQAANRYWDAALAASSFELGELKLKLKNAKGYNRQSLSLGGEKRSTAFGGRLVFGIDFGWAGNVPIRLENELFLSSGGEISKTSRHLTSGFLPGALVETELDVDLVAADTINLWLDIPVGSFPVKPYLGGGIGYACMLYHADVVINRGSALTETSNSRRSYDGAMVYRLGAGAAMATGKRSFIDLSLRYTRKQDWTASMSSFDLEFSAQQLDISLGWRHYF